MEYMLHKSMFKKHNCTNIQVYVVKTNTMSVLSSGYQLCINCNTKYQCFCFSTGMKHSGDMSLYYGTFLCFLKLLVRNF